MRHQRGVLAVTALSDGRIATGTRDGDVHIWDIDSWECEFTLKGHGGPVMCLTVLGDFLVSGSGDNTLRIWRETVLSDDSIGSPYKVSSLSVPRALSISYCPSILSLPNCPSILSLHTVLPYCPSILSLPVKCFEEQGKNYMTHHSVADLPTDALTIHSPPTHSPSTHSPPTHSPPTHSPSTHSSPTCSPPTHSPTHSSPTGSSPTHSSPSYSFMSQGGYTCEIVLTGHTGNVMCMVSTEDKLIVSGSADRTIRVWLPQNDKCLQVFTGHEGGVLAVLTQY